MLLKNIRIKNFKTIINASSTEIEIGNGLVVIGPNNSGKTNILEAIQMLFTGLHNAMKYDSKVHRPFQVTGTEQTSIMGVIEFEDKDSEIVELYQDINKLMGIADNTNTEIQLYLTFSPTGNPSYRIHPNMKRPRDKASLISIKLKQLVGLICTRFKVNYVPSNKSVEQLYYDLVNPFIKRSISSCLDEFKVNINRKLSEISYELNSTLSNAGIEKIYSRLNIPDDDIVNILSKFDYNVGDPYYTSIFTKGMGIQATAIFASFEWITKQEFSDGMSVLWLIEEPESYLHPKLYEKVNSILSNLQKITQVVKTTHSLSFVPNSNKGVLGTELQDGQTKMLTYNTFQEATQSIRDSIGVKFSDFLNLAEYNLFVEGITDKQYIDKVLEELDSIEEIDSNIRKLVKMRKDILVYNLDGTSQLEGFLRANWKFIKRERKAVSIFDGDQAGKKAIRNLNSYLNRNTIPFNANQDYIILSDGFEIEYLFPDDWIMEVHNEHPGWFESYALDMEDKIISLEIMDGRKNKYMSYMFRKIETSECNDWISKWLILLGKIANIFGL